MPAEYDVLIVGAGFSGIYLLHQLRKLGYNCRVYESGSDLGGVWHSNTYPGARVDSEGAIYQFSLPEVWKDWTWSEKYPGGSELQAYFAHLDKILDIKKDVKFNTTVTGAQFDRENSKKWTVETADGEVTTCRFLLLCVGFAAKRYTPDIPGIDTFKGVIRHSSFWPKEGVDVRGKRVALIGTGSTGVQIVQEWGKQADSLTVFQRTPNIALPMQQKRFSPEESAEIKTRLPQIFQERLLTFGGTLGPTPTKKTFDCSAEEREALFESLWQEGGFSLILNAYADVLIDEEANRVAYDFWVKKTRARIHDERTRDLLAPIQPFHPLGVKRSSLEQDYFEQFNRPNVELVNLREHSIVAIKPDGIETSDGAFYPVDEIALATGFDNMTGSLTRISGLRNTEGVPLSEEWAKDGAKTFLGLATRGYPNMFIAYGPQAPTALSNGPTSIEIQSQLIVDAIQKIVSSGLSYVEPTEEAQAAWKAQITQITNMTLFPKAQSWYMGDNIPGKKREMLNYPGGIPAYEAQCRKALESWEGFDQV